MRRSHRQHKQRQAGSGSTGTVSLKRSLLAILSCYFGWSAKTARELLAPALLGPFSAVLVPRLLLSFWGHVLDPVFSASYDSPKMGNMQHDPERRRHPRIKTKVPIELHCSGQPPMRTATEEISVCGCYIETMFTLDVGTKLELVFSLESDKLTVQGVVATKYPQVRNGIEFLDMAAPDRAKLNEFLANFERSQDSGSAAH